MTLTSILCPVDRSSVSRRALDYALALARWAGAHLTVLEVIDVTPPVNSAGMPEQVLIPDEIRESVRQELDHFTGPARAAGLNVEIRIEDGRVAERIVQAAAEISADLVVVGTHGRGGVQRLVLGSVAEKIVRLAACPVLTVPAGATQLPQSGAPFQTIVCPTDFSDASAAAVALAADLAARTSARRLLLHVVDWPFGHTTGPDPVTALRESLLAEARRELTALLPAPAGLPPVETLALVGHPGRQIAAVVREREADLIVMGVSGRSALDRAVLGSTTHHVLREACCPILTVRRAGAIGTTAKAAAG